MRQGRLIASLLLLAAWPASGVQAANASGAPIISLSPNGTVVSGTGEGVRASGPMLELLQQIQDLKQRVESLQNQIEVQNHELKGLERQQRDFFSDVDSRLSALKGGVAPVPPAGAPPPAADAASPVLSRSPATQKQYDHAFNLLRAAHYHAAVTAFQAFLKAHPRSSLAGNAHYWVAETYYVLGEYRHALPEFRIVVHRYKTSSKVPDSLFKVGYIEDRLGLPAKARMTWQKLVRQYPNSAAAALAKKHLHR
ncbi:MAG: tol-pal system protein YbgF [Acidiferrobacteraceae bacterium]